MPPAQIMTTCLSHKEQSLQTLLENPTDPWPTYDAEAQPAAQLYP